MNIDELLSECEEAFNCRDYENLLKISREALKKDPENQIAMGYNACSYCLLNQPQKALELLEPAIRKHPKNYYFKNILAMAYYGIGDYEKSLQCCDEGLEIKNFEWLWENRTKALIKLDRIDEAKKCYQNAMSSAQFCDLLMESGKCKEAFEHCMHEDFPNFERIIDSIKESDSEVVGDYFMSWIDAIKFAYDVRRCPDCGGDLLPIVWGLPGSELMEMERCGEVILGGCVVPINEPDYGCKKCGNQFQMGFEGLKIESDDDKIRKYAQYKIAKFLKRMRELRMIYVRLLDEVRDEIGGFGDGEFDAFIDRLTEIGYIYSTREGYIKLSGFDDMKCMKGYLDEGKFAAPRWLAFPQYSASTMLWRMGSGENYAMNTFNRSKEYEELFVMPKNWQFVYSGSYSNPIPPLGYLWTSDGKPVYPNVSDGTEVNDFITMESKGRFSHDTFTFDSLDSALEISKRRFLERYDENNLEMKWDDFSYSVLLNACYYKFMQDEDLCRRLLETGDEPLVYVCEDEENLLGRALMEVRDEIRRVRRNDDLIDWGYTEFLKASPWM